MFDLRTVIKDPKTGEVVRNQPYNLRIKDGIKIFARDGKQFYENGEEFVEQRAEEVSAPVQEQKTVNSVKKDSIASLSKQ